GAGDRPGPPRTGRERTGSRAPGPCSRAASCRQRPACAVRSRAAPGRPPRGSSRSAPRGRPAAAPGGRRGGGPVGTSRRNLHRAADPSNGAYPVYPIPLQMSDAGETDDPIGHLAQRMRALPAVPVPGLPRFTGGAVGYLGYDLVRTIERLPRPPADTLDLPDAIMMIADTLVIVDNLFGRAIV